MRKEGKSMTRKALRNQSLLNSIQTRIFLTLILTASVILAGFAFSDYFITSARMKRDFDDLAEYIVNQQSKSLALPLWYLDTEAIEGVIYSAMTEKQVYAIHIREETDIVYGKVRDDNWNIVEISKDFSSDYYFKSKEIFHNNEKLGDVEVFLTPKFMQEKLDGATVGMLMAIIVLNISLVAVLFISIRKSVINPVSRVAEGVRLIASGDLDRSIHSKSKDEIGRLASNVESMRLAIKKNINLVQEKNEALQIEISERKRTEAALRKNEKALKDARERLVRSEKLTALGKLAGTLGHEIKAPLSVIKHSFEFLKIRLDRGADEKIGKHLNMVHEKLDTIDKTIDDVLDFARTKDLQTIDIDPEKLVEDVLRDIFVPANIKIVRDLGSGLPRITVGETQIRQAFQNIISNAVDAMDEGGTLTVSTNINNGDNAGLESVTVSFQDTGEGISPDNVGKVFEPLFSTKVKGTGLGLVACENIIHAHGGSIEVASELGKGSTFIVKLPIKEK